MAAEIERMLPRSPHFRHLKDRGCSLERMKALLTNIVESAETDETIRAEARLVAYVKDKTGGAAFATLAALIKKSFEAVEREPLFSYGRRGYGRNDFEARVQRFQRNAGGGLRYYPPKHPRTEPHSDQEG